VSWWYGSWINKYQCNQSLSHGEFESRSGDTSLCDKGAWRKPPIKDGYPLIISIQLVFYWNKQSITILKTKTDAPFLLQILKLWRVKQRCKAKQFLLLLLCFTPLYYCCCLVLPLCFIVVILFYTFVSLLSVLHLCLTVVVCFTPLFSCCKGVKQTKTVKQRCKTDNSKTKV
jgi:hypothetical protein